MKIQLPWKRWNCDHLMTISVTMITRSWMVW